MPVNYDDIVSITLFYEEDQPKEWGLYVITKNNLLRGWVSSLSKAEELIQLGVDGDVDTLVSINNEYGEYIGRLSVKARSVNHDN